MNGEIIINKKLTKEENLQASTNRTIPISLPSVGEEEWLALREPIESGWLTQGPKVAEFEKKICENA